MTLLEMAVAARAYMDPSEIQYFVYHYPCKDGVGSTLAVHIIPEFRQRITFLPFDHKKEFDVTPLLGQNVIFADCAPTPEQYDQITAAGGKVLVLDHHEAAMKKLVDKPGCFYMLEREESGVSMLWTYCFTGAPLPRLFELIRDRDTFQNRFPDSEALYAALDKEHPRLTIAELAPYLRPSNLEPLLQRGRALIQAQRELIARLTASAIRGTVKLPVSQIACPATVVEVPDWSLTSQLGAALYNLYPTDVVMMWHPAKIDDKDAYKYYLRVAKGGPNVSDIAKEFVFGGKAGGGATESAGAVWDQSPMAIFTPTPRAPRPPSP
jgi:hypothetical protein